MTFVASSRALMHSLTEQLNDENFISTGIPDMLYEEDMEADYIDSTEPYNPSATAGDIEEEANVYDEYLGAELYFDVSPNGVTPQKGDCKEVLKGGRSLPNWAGTSQPIP